MGMEALYSLFIWFVLAPILVLAVGLFFIGLIVAWSHRKAEERRSQQIDEEQERAWKDMAALYRPDQVRRPIR